MPNGVNSIGFSGAKEPTKIGWYMYDMYGVVHRLGQTTESRNDLPSPIIDMDGGKSRGAVPGRAPVSVSAIMLAM